MPMMSEIESFRQFNYPKLTMGLFLKRLHDEQRTQTGSKNQQAEFEGCASFNSLRDTRRPLGSLQKLRVWHCEAFEHLQST
jgi:hypothetical protein